MVLIYNILIFTDAGVYEGFGDMAIRKRDTVKNGDKSFSKLFDIIEEIARSRNGLKGREIAGC